MGQQNAGKYIFLGTSGCIQVPSFHCSCEICEAARRTPSQRRTRASLALIGQETVVIDTGPDLEFQLEREAIRRVDRIFITHWHSDHICGLAGLIEPSQHAKWPRIEVYVPQPVIYHFDQELAYTKGRINLHPIRPGEKLDLPDGTWEVVKTNHTADSIGFIIEGSQKVAYLVDGIVPPPETVERLNGVDLLILESTMDELDEEWMVFSLPKAVEFWKQTGIKRCLLTHLSCHGWKDNQLVPGLSHAARMEFEARNPGLMFAYDGLKIIA